MSVILRRYATAAHVYLPMVKRGVVDLAVSADWTPAAGDVKVSKDGGAAANITTLPTAIAMGNTAYWDFSLSSTELTAAKVVVTVGDSATKAVEDQFFEIETYAASTAEFALDFGIEPRTTGTASAGGVKNITLASGHVAVHGDLIVLRSGSGAYGSAYVESTDGAGTPNITMADNFSNGPAGAGSGYIIYRAGAVVPGTIADVWDPATSSSRTISGLEAAALAAIRLALADLQVDMNKTNGHQLTGSGAPGDEFRAA